MAELVRTPVHHRLLRAVFDGGVRWDRAKGAYGSYAPVDGSVFSVEQLVAVYELQHAGLIRPVGDRARVTLSGSDKLVSWDRMQAVARG